MKSQSRPRNLVSTWLRFCSDYCFMEICANKLGDTVKAMMETMPLGLKSRSYTENVRVGGF